MHPQDTAIERAEQIAQELTSYKRVSKAEKELQTLTYSNSVLAQALKLDSRQIEQAEKELYRFRDLHLSQIRHLLNAGIEE